MSGKKLVIALLFCLFAASSAQANENIASGGDLKLKDLAGQEVDLVKYPGQSGKPMVLFFWTSWCPYCLKELKVIDKDEASAAGKVDLFAINTGESRKDAERVVRNYKLQVHVLVDDKSIAADLFGVVGVPTFVMVNAKGEIVFQENYFPSKEIAALTGK